MPRSGLQYAAEVEWRLAAAWARYRYEDFQQLEGELQSAHVAAYRIHAHAESLLASENARRSSQRHPSRSGK